MDKKTIIFIVGTPRSGTTLLQQMMASNFELSTSEETHFYRHYHKYPFTGGFLNTRKLGISLSKILPCTPINKIYIRRQVFGDVVSRRLDMDENTVFVEKTPMHLQYLNEIESDLKNCFNLVFVHIFRRKYENVRSLYIAAQRNPKAWSGQRSVGKCVKRWQKDMKIHLCNIGTPNHYFVSYENIVFQSGITKFLNRLQFDLNLKSRNKNDPFDVRRIISEGEKWKNNNLCPLGHNSTHEDFMTYEDFVESYGVDCFYEKLKSEI